MAITCSAAQADVVTALGDAANGETINIQAGNETWASAVTIPDKSLKIIGAGQLSTVITGYGFSVATGVDDWRVSGIGWTTASNHLFMEISAEMNTTGCHDWRIDNCRFADTSAIAMKIHGYSRGLVDNCDFHDDWYSIIVDGADDLMWTEPSGFGSNDFVFIEDCEFDHDSRALQHIVVGNYGARWVIRYCTVTESESYLISDWFDAHGAGHATNRRGSRAYELYHNMLIKKKAGFARAFRIRGGVGVIYENIIDESAGNAFSAYFSLNEYRASEVDTMHPPVAGATDYCPVGDGGEGYPCWDQIGRGDNQATEGLYLWSNIDELGSPITTVTVEDGCVDYIQEDRDYFKSAKSGYTPYTYPHPLRGEPEAIDSALWGDWSYAQFPFEVVKPSRHISVFF